MTSAAIEMPKYVRVKLSIPADVREWLHAREADVFGIYDNLGKCPDWHPNGDLDAVTKDLLFTENDQQKTPLDNPFTWDSFASWMKRLVDKDDALTKADFLQTNAEGRTWLEQASRSGHFGSVVRYLNARGESITRDELLTPQGEANDAYAAAVAWGQHGEAFSRENWDKAPLEDLNALIQPLPKSAVKQIPNRFALHQQLRMEQDGQQMQRGR